jgi:copper transport protein
MWRRVALTTLLAGLWLVATGPAAGAHAMLRAADPAAGSSIERAPRALTLRFSEAPDPGLSAVHLLDALGREVSTGRTTPTARRPLELRLPLPTLGSGTYTVTWRVVSRVDGHLSQGSFAFGVGVPATATAATATAATATATARLAVASGADRLARPSALAVAARWAFYWGLALLVGAAATGLTVFGRRLPGRPGPLLGAGLALAAAGLIAMISATASTAGVPPGRLLGSATGRLLEARAVALLLACVAVAGVLRSQSATGTAGPAPRSGRAGWLLALGAASGGGLLVHALAGHAAAPSSVRWLNLIAQWGHLLMVGVWIGGLVWLLADIRDHSRADMAGAVLRFSRLATFSLAVVAVTGLLRAVQELGGWQRLLSTSFGRTLDVKLGLFAALVGLGALNHFRVVPALASGNGRLSWLRRTVRGELWLAGGVLLAAALLSELPPGTDSITAAAGATAAAVRPAAPSGLQVSGTDYTTTVRVTLQVTPGAAGPNRFLASVADYDTGAPLRARRVQIDCSLPARPDVGMAELDLRRGGDGRWHGQAALLSIAGRWAITTLVESPSGGVTVPLQLQVSAPATG